MRSDPLTGGRNSFAAGLVLLVGLCACTSEPIRQPRPSVPDKQALFGDPSLVPTREGEQLRRELALAGELERLLAARQLDARVSVSLPDGRRVERARVVMIVDAPDHEPLRAELLGLSGAVVPGVEPSDLYLSFVDRSARADADAPTRSPGGSLALLAALGLGLALGTAIERARTRGHP